VIRPAVAEDTGAIAALEQELFGAEAWSADQVVEELTGYGRRGWVSVDGRRGLVGYVIMRTVGEISDLQRIGVARSGQRAGVASGLLAVACAGVRAEGAERILLEVAEDNTAARAFYAREGFVAIDRRPRYYRHDVDALVLQRELAQ
jgi:ribosomal protein S18 acetylase RimI-like enzyme